MKNRVAVVLFSGLLLLGWLFRDNLVFYWVTRDWAGEKAYDRTSFTHVAHEILAGNLKENADGMVVLPQENASVTADGKVYVTHKSGNLGLLLFTTWRGKGSNLKGYLFCTRPLKATEIQKDFYTHKADAIQVKGPRPVTPAPTPVGEVEVWLERRINDQWYSAAYGLD
jgi:hypothetical protein